jgi:hypothetical protein
MLYCANDSKARLRQAMVAAGPLEMSYDFDYEGAKVLVNFSRHLVRLYLVRCAQNNYTG